MDENMKHYYDQNEKSEIEMGKEQQNLAEQEKKQEEISQKKAHPFNFHQLKDDSLDKEIWGSLKARTSESLGIAESEPFYRTPITNVIEGEQEYYLIMELPGLSKKNVELSLQEGILEIKGELSIKIKDKKEAKKDKEKEKKKEKDKEKKKDKKIKGNHLRREFRSHSYFRSFILPEDIIAEGIEAKFKSGVLKLIIPKKIIDESGKHVIEIK